MIVLVDVYNCAYASYYALKSQLRDTEPHVAALFGFLRILTSQLRANPGYSHVFLCFDQGQSWRCELDPLYKANRHQAPTPKKQAEKDSIRAGVMAAVEKLHDMTEYAPWHAVRSQGIEADDLIAALRKHYKSEPALIISGDKDLYQLLTYPNTTVYAPTKSAVIGPHNWDDNVAVKTKTERLVVPIENYLHFRCLSGDNSDNIPGVAGIGEVTAARLCQNGPFDKARLFGTDAPVSPDLFTREDPATYLKESGVKTWKSLGKKLWESNHVHKGRFTLNHMLMSLEVAAERVIRRGLDDMCSHWTINWDREGREIFQNQLEDWKMKSILNNFQPIDYLAAVTASHIGEPP